MQRFTELAAGTYTVSETGPTDWFFDKVERIATDWSSDGAKVTANLTDGEAAVCTFYNTDTDTHGPGELPYTGDPYLLPLLVAGLWALLMGLGLAVWSTMKEADAA